MSRFLIAFDYDGVIVDSLNHNVHVAKQACLAMGITKFPTPHDFEMLETVSFEELGRYNQIPEDRIAEFAAIIFEQLSHDAGLLSAFKGLPELLVQLSQQHILVVITTNSEKAVSSFLKRHKLDSGFSLVLGAEFSGSKRKKIIHAADHFNVDRKNVFMIGDAVNDIREAKAADVKSIAVTWGFQSQARLKHEYPDYIVDSPEELMRIVEENTF